MHVFQAQPCEPRFGCQVAVPRDELAPSMCKWKGVLLFRRHSLAEASARDSRHARFSYEGGLKGVGTANSRSRVTFYILSLGMCHPRSTAYVVHVIRTGRSVVPLVSCSLRQLARTEPCSSVLHGPAADWLCP